MRIFVRLGIVLMFGVAVDAEIIKEGAGRWIFIDICLGQHCFWPRRITYRKPKFGSTFDQKKKKSRYRSVCFSVGKGTLS